MTITTKYRRSPSYPGKFNIVTWGDAVQPPALTTDDTSGENYGRRQLIDSSVIAKGGTKVRVTFESAATEALTVDGAYIGHQAASGDPYDFDGNQVELLFSAGSGFAISSGSTITSDDTTFDFDASKDLIVSFGISSTSGQGGQRFVSSATGYTNYEKAAGNGEEGTTDVTGYSTINNIVICINKIEAFG